MTLLEKHGSHISETKVTLYGVYVLLVLMCGSEVWPVITSLAILGDLTLLIHSVSVKSLGSVNKARYQLSGRLPAVLQFPKNLIRERRLRFFGHVVRADPEQDHHRLTGASLRPPSHRRRPCGRPRTSWLTATDTDVQSVNIGIHSAWRKASDRTL